MNLKITELRLGVTLFAAIACCVLTSFAQAETIVLNASKDNTLFNSTAGDASNGAGPLFAGRTGGQGPGAQRAVLAFDLAGEIPAGSIITDVQLTLNILQSGGGSGDDSYSLHRLEQDWGEGSSNATGGAGTQSEPGDATWIHTFYDSSTWNNPGGDFDGSPSASEIIGNFGLETWGSTDEMVADAQGWLDDPTNNFGWILIGDESQPASSRQFSSREFSNGAPALTVTYRAIPEPGSLALALLGALGSFSFLRRPTSPSA